MLLTETILKCGSSEQACLLQVFCIPSSLWLRNTQVWSFVTNYLLFCPPWCSWRGSGWRVWGVQNSKGGLRVPQGQVWVWRHPAVQQPALLSHAPRTPDPCGVPHPDLWAGQGAHSFSSKCVQQQKKRVLRFNTILISVSARRGFWRSSAVLPRGHRRFQRSFPWCPHWSPHPRHGNQLYHVWWPLNFHQS